jgi:hypothetical protein
MVRRGACPGTGEQGGFENEDEDEDAGEEDVVPASWQAGSGSPYLVATWLMQDEHSAQYYCGLPARARYLRSPFHPNNRFSVIPSPSNHVIGPASLTHAHESTTPRCPFSPSTLSSIRPNFVHLRHHASPLRNAWERQCKVNRPKPRSILLGPIGEGKCTHHSLSLKLRPGTVGQQMTSSCSSNSVGSFPLLMIDTISVLELVLHSRLNVGNPRLLRQEPSVLLSS